LLTKLKGFAQTSSYMVWEQALVDKFTELGGNPFAPADDMAASEKQKTRCGGMRFQIFSLQEKCRISS
jgi:hypothetical protein